MKILCFGDSNTFGYDPCGFFGGRYTAANRWVDLLAEKSGWEVINCGENGREIPRADFFRLPASLSREDILLVMLGTNDLLQGQTAVQTAERMERFLLEASAQHENIVLVSPPHMVRGAWVPDDMLVAESIRLAEEYKKLAQTLKISFIDTHSWDVELTFDGVHFTERGHHIFAENLLQSLEKWRKVP